MLVFSPILRHHTFLKSSNAFLPNPWRRWAHQNLDILTAMCWILKLWYRISPGTVPNCWHNLFTDGITLKKHEDDIKGELETCNGSSSGLYGARCTHEHCRMISSSKVRPHCPRILTSTFATTITPRPSRPLVRIRFRQNRYLASLTV